MQISVAKSHCAEGNVVKEVKGIGYQPYMTYLRKFGAIDIIQHSGESKTEISCRKMDGRTAFSKFARRSTA